MPLVRPRAVKHTTKFVHLCLIQEFGFDATLTVPRMRQHLDEFYGSKEKVFRIQPIESERDRRTFG